MRTLPTIIASLLLLGSALGDNTTADIGTAAPPPPRGAPTHIGPVFQDLASPNPEIRAHAAAEIKASKLYRPTDDDPWQHAKSHLKKGESIDSVLDLFRKAGAVDVPASAKEMPPTCDYGFQLDDGWMLEIYYKDYTLLEWHLLEAPRLVEVPPPANYTGIWVVYHLDGMAARENFRNGQPMPLE